MQVYANVYMSPIEVQVHDIDTFRIIPLQIFMCAQAKSQNLLPGILRDVVPLIFLNRSLEISFFKRKAKQQKQTKLFTSKTIKASD